MHSSNGSLLSAYWRMPPYTFVMLLVAGVMGAAGALGDPCGPVRVDPASQQFVDRCGRVRFFRGVNVIYKGAPWHPDVTPGGFSPTQSFSDVDASLIASLGMNTIRLGVMWPGVQPAKGIIDTSYMYVMTNLTSMLGSHGIYPLIDLHQDSFSGVFCGEGAPDWAARQYSSGAAGFPLPIEAAYAINASTGEPSVADCNKHDWTDYYFTSALGAATQNMYQNTNGSAEDFYQFWSQVGYHFNAEAVTSSVLGFELMNEPWAGDVLGDPLLLVPGVADRVNLQGFFINGSNAIRAGEAAQRNGIQHVVFTESVTWDDFLPMGFDTLPGSGTGLGAISFHYYDLPNFNIDWQISARQKDAQRLQVGALLTEFDFGATDLTEMNSTLDACDAHQVGYIAWEYKSFWPITGVNNGFFNADGSIFMAKAVAFARTFPMAVAGTVASYGFNTSTSVFVLNYTLSTSATAPTVVYTSDLVYLSGVSVNVTSDPPGAAKWRLEPHSAKPSPNGPGPFNYTLLYVEAAANAPAGARVSVVVTPV